MLFYKAEGTVKTGFTSVEGRFERASESASMMFSQMSDSFYQSHRQSIYIFVSMLRHSKIVLGIITDSPDDIPGYIDEYLNDCGIGAELKTNEVTISAFINILNSNNTILF